MKTSRASPLVIEAFGATHVGRSRKHNEDSVLVRPDLCLFAVADGAGGHQAGEVASALAVRSLANYFGATVRATHDNSEFDGFGVPVGARRLSAAIHKANRDVLEIARTHERHRGMGTTVVAVSFSPRSALVHVGHAGDSRCYRLRGTHLEQLTKDHSLLTDLLEQRPDLDEGVLAKLPQNVVTRALGMEHELRVSMASHAALPGDRFLLCSDGLSSMLPPLQLADTLSQQEPPETVTHLLIAMANSAGGRDNIAALVVDCEGEPPGAPSWVPPSPTADSYEGEQSDPELLIIGIEELDVAELLHGASDELLDAVKRLAQNQR
ncbi:MAG TPA: protein phosphatase 2C domain-containing protein [Polyangiaceae bacterium]|jgi:protein phosphatase